MKVYKFTLYLYLIFGLFFLYDAISTYLNPEPNRDFKISLAFAVVAIFMFFFRKRHIKRIEENQKNKQ